MKCKNCAAELRKENDVYVCAYCGSSFFKEELLSAQQQPEFVVKGGVLTSYVGNSEIVYIPEGVIAIGNGAFRGNLSVKRVVFSKSVAEIGNNAFEGCSSLTEISGYESVQRFGNEAFFCSGIKKIEIGEAVSHIGKHCFSRMPNLRSVVYAPQKNIKLDRTFAYCSSLSEVSMDKNYFFPSFHTFYEVRNNPGNKRPTYTDAFAGTPFIEAAKARLMALYNSGTCPECRGRVRKGCLHAKCTVCGIDYYN